MSRSILAYDLGTGGAKASLDAEDGARLGVAFAPYETFYPATGWHEQRPGAWWAAMARTTRELLGMAPGARVARLLPIFERTRVEGAALSELLQRWQP